LITVAVIGTITTIMVPAFQQYLVRLSLKKVVLDIRSIEFRISVYENTKGRFPDTLDDLDGPPYVDPWGNEYQYLSNTDPNWVGMGRQDRFLKPLNSDYDLYSMGADGLTVRNLNGGEARDDIIRANNGGFVGPASEY
jgi:general secretion pathway protein G